jgi:hypothetical protein
MPSLAQELELEPAPCFDAPPCLSWAAKPFASSLLHPQLPTEPPSAFQAFVPQLAPPPPKRACRLFGQTRRSKI